MLILCTAGNTSMASKLHINYTPRFRSCHIFLITSTIFENECVFGVRMRDVVLHFVGCGHTGSKITGKRYPVRSSFELNTRKSCMHNTYSIYFIHFRPTQINHMNFSL